MEIPLLIPHTIPSLSQTGKAEIKRCRESGDCEIGTESIEDSLDRIGVSQPESVVAADIASGERLLACCLRR